MYIHSMYNEGRRQAVEITFSTENLCVSCEIEIPVAVASSSPNIFSPNLCLGLFVESCANEYAAPN